jgi:hypothetical protein
MHHFEDGIIFRSQYRVCIQCISIKRTQKHKITAPITLELRILPFFNRPPCRPFVGALMFSRMGTLSMLYYSLLVFSKNTGTSGKLLLNSSCLKPPKAIKMPPNSLFLLPSFYSLVLSFCSFVCL